MKPFYKDDTITIYHSDCLEAFRTLADKSIDGIITDPPYSLSTSSNRRSANKPMGWSDINNASFWFTAWYKEVWRTLSDNGCFWTFCSWRTLPIVQCASSQIGGMYITSVVVWDKNWPGVGSTKGIRETFELLVLFAKPNFKIKDRSIRNIWTIPWNSHRPNGHPSEKPELLIDKILEASNLVGTIFDPFCGSGTVGESVTKRGLKFIGNDIEKIWCKRTKSRILERRGQQLNLI